MISINTFWNRMDAMRYRMVEKEILFVKMKKSTVGKV
jgi:hypothetical protein